MFHQDQNLCLEGRGMDRACVSTSGPEKGTGAALAVPSGELDTGHLGVSVFMSAPLPELSARAAGRVFLGAQRRTSKKANSVA